MDCIEEKIGQRNHSRRPVSFFGDLLTASKRQPVLIKDISIGGARLQLRGGVASTYGLLSWEDGKAWGEIVWHDGEYAGLKFCDEEGLNVEPDAAS